MTIAVDKEKKLSSKFLFQVDIDQTAIKILQGIEGALNLVGSEVF